MRFPAVVSPLVGYRWPNISLNGVLPSIFVGVAARAEITPSVV